MNTQNTENLLQQIEDLLECIYSARFTKRSELTKKEVTEPGNNAPLYQYVFKMYLHDLKWCPLVISGEFETDEEFLVFMYEEFRSRNLIRSEYYKVILKDDCN